MILKPKLWILACAVALSLPPMYSPAQVLENIEPQVTDTGIEYVAGGVGDSEQQAMDAMRRKYDLRLTFARKTGEYLTDVEVVAENKKGKVLEVVTPGPLLFAKVPDGTYKITARFNGERQTKIVNVKKGRAKDLVYYFATPS